MFGVYLVVVNFYDSTIYTVVYFLSFCSHSYNENRFLFIRSITRQKLLYVEKTNGPALNQNASLASKNARPRKSRRVREIQLFTPRGANFMRSRLP